MLNKKVITQLSMLILIGIFVILPIPVAANLWDAITGQNEKYFNHCTKSSQYNLTDKQFLKACLKVTKMGNVNYATEVHSNFWVGKLLKRMGDDSKAQSYLTFAANNNCSTEELCRRSCEAFHLLEQYGATIGRCSGYLREYGYDEIVLFNRGASYYELESYEAAIRDLRDIPSQNAAYLTYKSYLELGAENSAEEFRRSSGFLKNGTAANEAVVKVAKKEAARNEKFAVIAYCEKNGAVGTATNQAGYQAGRKAYKDCLSQEFKPSSTECCKIIASTEADICVSVARHTNGALFSSEGSKSSVAARNAKEKCNHSSCEALATKCITDQ